MCVYYYASTVIIYRKCWIPSLTGHRQEHTETVVCIPVCTTNWRIISVTTSAAWIPSWKIEGKDNQLLRLFVCFVLKIQLIPKHQLNLQVCNDHLHFKNSTWQQWVTSFCSFRSAQPFHKWPSQPVSGPRASSFCLREFQANSTFSHKCT